MSAAPLSAPEPAPVNIEGYADAAGAIPSCVTWSTRLVGCYGLPHPAVHMCSMTASVSAGLWPISSLLEAQVTLHTKWIHNSCAALLLDACAVS
jgi:hypothetical protein